MITRLDPQFYSLSGISIKSLLVQYFLCLFFSPFSFPYFHSLSLSKSDVSLHVRSESPGQKYSACWLYNRFQHHHRDVDARIIEIWEVQVQNSFSPSKKTQPKPPPLVNFIGNYCLLCRLKAWFSVLWWENYSKLSHHLWYSCGLFRGMAQLLSIKLLYQTDLCTIRRVCSQDKIEKNYIMYYSPFFLPKMLGSLIYCCPGRQVAEFMCVKHLRCTFCTIPSQNAFTQRCPPADVQIRNVSL